MRDHGVRKVTISEIAHAAGVGKGTVYRYWPSATLADPAGVPRGVGVRRPESPTVQGLQRDAIAAPASAGGWAGARGLPE